MSTVPYWEYATIIICLLLSGFFSASETALTAISEVKAGHLIERYPRLGSGLQLWTSKPAMVLTSILVGNNLVNIAASAVATDISARLFSSSSLPIAIGIMTFLVLVFGEVMPKNSVRAKPEMYAMISTHILRLFYYAIWPVTILLYGITKGVLWLAGTGTDRAGPSVTEAEIEHMVRISQEEGEIEEHEEAMIHAVFEFGDLQTKEIMVPRTDMVTVPTEITLDDLKRVVSDCGHSRIPVHRKRIDNIVGILYAKDLLRIEHGSNFRITSLVRPPFYVPETKRLNELLREFQQRRVHMAIVVDEYGGTSGLVTLEDILEQLVGDIRDEFDDEAPLIVKLDDNRFEADARMNLDDLSEALDIEFPDQPDYETLGGFITDICGCVPQPGKQVRWDNLIFRILKAEPTRVVKIGIERLGHDEEADNEQDDNPDSNADNKKN
ncbi:MAG: HlyC/CorC family transporter [Deltaproteobacteria bacterium]|nr:HlyC/CorC family transporter [Deltaproteobacteria bacterium]